MNRWMRNALVSASLFGALAVVPGAIAYAHDASHAEGHDKDHRGHHGGLLQAALRLDSLTADQRTSIEQLAQQSRAASTPVRLADAQVLTILAQQVEGAAIDPQALAPSLTAEQSAANAEAAVDRDALVKLHALLTPAQRGQLVDGIVQRHTARDGEREHEHARGAEEGHDGLGRGLGLTPEQRTQIQARLVAQQTASGGAMRKGERGKMLEAFRSDAFDPSALMIAHNRGARMEEVAAAMVPVLTPAQRDAFATHLRKRAAHEAAPKGA